MLELILEKVLEYLVPICELIGIFIVAVSVARSFAEYLKCLSKRETGTVKYDLANGLALALEFKMAAEILKTVLVKDMSELLVLGAVIVLRALLSLLIHFEMKGNEGADRTVTLKVARNKEHDGAEMVAQAGHADTGSSFKEV